MTRNEHVEISRELLQIEELAGKANQIWDGICSNLMYANMSTEKQVEEYEQTDQAVKIHVEAMHRLESVRERLNDIMERTISDVILN